MNNQNEPVLFESNRLFVRRLKASDLALFHQLQSNAEVMKYVQLTLPDIEENKADLAQLIARYEQLNNDIFIYAVCLRNQATFIGTVALVKNELGEDEIGYRLLPSVWGSGYGKEVVGALIDYCRAKGFTKLVACVAVLNRASLSIIKHHGFYFEYTFESDLNLQEHKYSLAL